MPTSQPSETKKTESGTSIDSYSEENDPWHAYPGGPDAWWYSPFTGEWERILPPIEPLYTPGEYVLGGEMMMKVETQRDRGFRTVRHAVYEGAVSNVKKAMLDELRIDSLDDRIITESSAIGDYEDAFDRPGSSFLWIGFKWHLDRDEVQDLINIMQTWIKTGRLPHAD